VGEEDSWLPYFYCAFDAFDDLDDPDFEDPVSEDPEAVDSDFDEEFDLSDELVFESDPFELLELPDSEELLEPPESDELSDMFDLDDPDLLSFR